MLADRLLAGYRQYRQQRYSVHGRRLAQLARLGQAPHAMVIGCCDSRAAPEVIFSADPGDLFVLRNVANVVPPHAPDGELHGTSAAIEFAVLGLMVPEIVVLGHSRCGGISAYLRGAHDETARGEFIGPWMDLIDDVRDLVDLSGRDPADPDTQRLVEEAAIRLSLRNLRTFPAIREREESGRLGLAGAHFDIGSGELRLLDEATGDFIAAE